MKPIGSESLMFIVGALFCLWSISARSQEWIDVKDAKEIRAVLSNKTLSGIGPDGRPSVSYFRGDGTGLRIVDNQRTTRTWEVKADDQYCVTETDTYCFSLQRHATKRDEIRVTLEPGLHILDFHIDDGVPKF